MKSSTRSVKSSEWSLDNGILYHRGKVYIPNSNLQHHISALCHDSKIAGHAGRWKTLELVSRNYWWPQMSRYISRYVSTCNMCLCTRTSQQSPVRELHLLPIPDAPWDTISVDFIVVRVSPVALRFRSKMDPWQRDLMNILLSCLISDSFGPVLGARAWSCKTTDDYLGLSRLQNTLETFRGRCLRLPPGLLMFYIIFLLYGLMGLTILDHIYSSFL